MLTEVKESMLMFLLLQNRDAASAVDVSSSAKRDAQKNAKSVCNNADVSTIVLVVPSLSSSTLMMGSGPLLMYK